MSRARLLSACLIAGLATAACGPDGNGAGMPDADTSDPTAEQMPATNRDSPLAGTAWQLTSIADSTVAPGDNPATLEFLGNGRVAGNTGCNSTGGTYTVTGAKLAIGPLATTRMACLEDRVMWIEAAYLRTIDATRSFHVEGDLLILLDQAGDTIASFIRSRN